MIVCPDFCELTSIKNNINATGRRRA